MDCIALATTYIQWFDGLLYTIFPVVRGFDYQGKIIFCVALLIGLQVVGVVCEKISGKLK